MASRLQIKDGAFRRAVELLDAGDVEGLRGHLGAHPGVVHQRIALEGESYFRNPSLLEFAAENPVRRGTAPAKILDIVRLLLESGSAQDRASVDSTLALVSSGRVARESGVQAPLIALLTEYGANPNSAMSAALAHGEFEAVDALLARGAKLDLSVAAGTGRADSVQRLLPAADARDRQLALAFAAQHGYDDIVRLLLDAGADPNQLNPAGAHAHSTPLHQAALAGHEDVVASLIERGARLDTKDAIYHGTPLDWAKHAGHTQVVEYLRQASGRQ
jgi:ankyrin repeat protein